MSKVQINLLMVGALILVLAVLASVRLGKRDAAPAVQAQAEPEAAVVQGRSYLQGLENQDPTMVDAVRKDYLEQEMIAQRQARLDQLASGEVDVWSLFEDYVLLGDSRLADLAYYEFLPRERVLAEKGVTIRYVDERLEDVKKLNPTTIFLCFGLNDLESGIWKTPGDYAQQCLETVQKLKQTVPGCTVYLNSILPVEEKACMASDDLRQIPAWNEALCQMCQENDIPFVDNDEVSARHMDLWEVDGAHLCAGFYPYWGSNMMLAVYDNLQVPAE